MHNLPGLQREKADNLGKPITIKETESIIKNSLIGKPRARWFPRADSTKLLRRPTPSLHSPESVLRALGSCWEGRSWTKRSHRKTEVMEVTWGVGAACWPHVAPNRCLVHLAPAESHLSVTAPWAPNGLQTVISLPRLSTEALKMIRRIGGETNSLSKKRPQTPTLCLSARSTWGGLWSFFCCIFSRPKGSPEPLHKGG